MSDKVNLSKLQVANPLSRRKLGNYYVIAGSVSKVKPLFQTKEYFVNKLSND